MMNEIRFHDFMIDEKRQHVLLFVFYMDMSVCMSVLLVEHAIMLRYMKNKVGNIFFVFFLNCVSFK